MIEKGGITLAYYLAIDIGASSGRHILGKINNNQLILEEVYRFKNDLVNIDGQICWDIDTLFKEILVGIKKCKDLKKFPESISVDTWGVDFVLLDKEDRRIGNAVSYRDKRTLKAGPRVASLINERELYKRTGIQKQIFNTIYQFMAIKMNYPEQLERAESFLMIPDYINFLLTGVKRQEYTNATTTQLVNTTTHQWDYDLIERLGYQKELFLPLSMPGSYVGSLKKKIIEEVGFNCKVIHAASHDTASAVLAVPGEKEIYISSGTWSLVGTEIDNANCSKISQNLNFSNEGGFNYSYRFLKNIMGLWMIQSLQREWEKGYSFSEIVNLATKEPFLSIVDCNDPRFLSPKNMVVEVQKFCKETGQEIPKTLGEIASVIYNSLAKCYSNTIDEMQAVLEKKFNTIYIIGGGANAELLNHLTAKYTQKVVYAGPTEATAIGNLIVQMLYAKEFVDIKKVKECIRHSFNIRLIKKGIYV